MNCPGRAFVLDPHMDEDAMTKIAEDICRA